MHYFADQDRARSRTYVLVAIFALFTVLIAVGAGTVWLLLTGAFANACTLESSDCLVDILSVYADYQTQEEFLHVTIAVGCLILAVSLGKYLALRAGGGEKVAEGLGGHPVTDGTSDPLERRLLNINSEMALAAGITPPRVYVLEDPSINAFAAGYNHGSAVIGVTRGALTSFSRAELQGVIAHEYSHILNGDMRLNMRLISIIFGITALGMVGMVMLRSAYFSPRKSAAPFALVGIGLMIFGAVGTFAGRLIQAAVSRQREFLADASAVQFTRNPGGIALALKRLLAGGRPARLTEPRAVEARHMFFSESVAMFSLATHPPLAQRIKRLQPDWDGQVDKSLAVPTTMSTGQEGEMTAPSSTGVGIKHLIASASEQLAISRGSKSHAHLDAAQDLYDSIPDKIRQALENPLDSVALVHAMLIDQSLPEVLAHQISHLDKHAPPYIREHAIGTYLPELKKVRGMVRLALVELLVPALRELSGQQYERFRSNMAQLIAADEKVAVFEWALFSLLTFHLDEAFGLSRRGGRQCRLDRIGPELSYLLSVLAQQSKDSEAAYAHAAAKMQCKMLPYEKGCNLERLEKSLNAVRNLIPEHREQAVDAMVEMVEFDGRITRHETELLRVFAHILDCPLPVVLSQRSAD